MHGRPEDEISALANPDAYTWRPLGILSIYRMVIVASICLLYLGTRGTEYLQAARPGVFLGTVLAYFGLSVLAHLLVRAERPGFYVQVCAQLTLDIVAIALLILASGTVGNGLGALMVVAIAGGSILVGMRTAVAFAALASLLLLSLQVVSHLRTGNPGVGYSQVGFLGVTIFVTAVLGSLLAQRARQNQALADRRGDALKSLEALNGHVVQQIQAGVVALAADGRVRLVNPAAWDLLGRPSRATGAALSDLSPALQLALETWQLDETNEPVELDLSGRSVTTRFQLLGEHGEQGVLAFLDDTAALRTQIQQGKLAALGRLTASIAHEIRNPLGAIQHAAQLLQESDSLTDTDRRLAEIVQKQGTRLNRVVENVLQLSRRQQALRATVKLRPVLEGFAADFRLQHPFDRYTVTTSTSPDTLEAEFDPDHLGQVLANLCRNALQHAGLAEGLKIELNAVREPDGRPALFVHDNGRGIEPSVAAELFQPFFTTSNMGTGLGLYLCRELCESNGAHLSLTPSATGTCFRISFAKPDDRGIA